MKRILTYLLSILICWYGYALPASWEAYISQDKEKAQELMHAILFQSTQKQFTPLQTAQLVKKLEELYAIYLKKAQSDDALSYFTWPDQSYTNGLYKPKDLSPITTSYYLRRDQTMPASQYQVRSAVHAPLDKFAQAYYTQFKEPLRINSARRSYHEQQNRFSPTCFNEWICARPGTSEHQNGFTIDIWWLHNKKHERMRNNAHIYGFHQSYQKGKEIDGLQAEPRHRRRVWTTLAWHLHANNLSFTQRSKERTDVSYTQN